MARVARGPQAESVVVLAHEDHESAAGALHGAEPLLGVQRGGSEERRVLPAIAPLDATERVRAEVDEEGSLEPHPGALVGSRQDLRGLLGRLGGGVLRRNHVPGRVLDRRGLAATGVRQPGHESRERDSSRDGDDGRHHSSPGTSRNSNRLAEVASQSSRAWTRTCEALHHGVDALLERGITGASILSAQADR